MKVYIRYSLDKIPYAAVIYQTHQSKALKIFELFQTRCCNALNRHTSAATRELRSITLEKSVVYNMVLTGNEKKIFPGQKICSSCRKILNKRFSELEPAPVVILPKIVYEEPPKVGERTK